MKGIYFPNSDFLEAKRGCRASWLWSSILEGGDYMRKGMLWQIGDGGRIRVWKDEWFPASSDHKLSPFDPSSVDMNFRVCSLISHVSNVWDLSSIEDSIFVDNKMII